MALAQVKKCDNIDRIFASIYAGGNVETFNTTSAPHSEFEEHVQGYAVYARDGKRIYIASHNMPQDKGDKSAFLLFMYQDGHNFAYPLENEREYRHPGGMQVLGDYLLVGIENNGGGMRGSYLKMYDLRPTLDRQPPVACNGLNILREWRGAAACGMTRYTGNDGKERYLLVSFSLSQDDANTFSFREAFADEEKELPDCDFSTAWTFRLTPIYDVQNVALITESREKGPDKIYLLILANKPVYPLEKVIGKLPIAFEDHVMLYDVDPVRRCIEERTFRHFYTKHMGQKQGYNGVHFRFGAGVEIKASNEIILYATQRKCNTNDLPTNYFPSNKTILCKNKPGGRANDVEDDFKVEYFGKGTLRFDCYTTEWKPAPDIIFDLRRNKSGSDESIKHDMKSGDVWTPDEKQREFTMFFERTRNCPDTFLIMVSVDHV